MNEVERNFSKLEKAIGVKFRDVNLLKQAFTHSSWVNENKGLEDNERLEFLGDSILGVEVAKYLYKKFPTATPRKLTEFRASLVNAIILNKVAKKLCLEEYFYVVKNAANINRVKLFADLLEALIAAIYLDQGEEVVSDFIRRNIITQLDYIIRNELYYHPKQKFQEFSQKKFNKTPTYNLLSNWGSGYNKKCQVGLYLGQELIAKGIGTSSKRAEKNAAKNGIKKMKW